MRASIILLGLLPALPALAAPTLDSRASRFTLYDLNTPATGPCDLAEGPDGAIWGQSILKKTSYSA